MQGNTTQSQLSDNLPVEVLQTGKSKELTFFTTVQRVEKIQDVCD